MFPGGISTRSRGGRGRLYVLIGIAVALMAIAGTVGSLSSKTQAQTAATPSLPSQVVANCFPPDASNNISCSFLTSSRVAPGGTMVIQLTNPFGATITRLNGVPIGCALSGGLTTAVVTVACAIASLGMPVGSVFTQIIALPPGSVATTQFLTESVTYNANGAAPQVPSPITETGAVPGVALTSVGTCTAYAVNLVPPPPFTSTCTNTPAQTTVAGGTLTLTITAPPNQTIAAIGPPPLPAFPGCPSTTTGLTPPSNVVTITYACTTGTIPGNVPIMVTIGGSGPLGATPTELTTSANPGPGGGICTPSALPTVGGSVTFTCIPTVTTVDGGTLTVTVNAPSCTGCTVQITAAPTFVGGGPNIAGAPNKPVGPCLLTTPIPQAPTPAGTAIITYTCATGASIPAPPIDLLFPLTFTVVSNAGIATLSITDNANGGTGANIITPFPEILNVGPCAPMPVGLTVAGATTSTCPAPPFGPGTITQAGETLAFQITGAVGQTLFVATGGAPATIGPCSLTTPLPTNVSFPEGTLTINYTCTTNQTAPTGADLITVTSGNGVAGTPIEVIAVIAPLPPPGIPPPSTDSITLTIAGISGPIPTATATASATGTTTGTPSALCTGAATATPSTTGSGGTSCATFNFNCVNPAGVTPPATPASGSTSPALATGGPYAGVTGQPVQFRGAATATFGNTITACIWDFGDGAKSFFLTPAHTYALPGVYTATLTVTDSGKTNTPAKSTTTVTITAQGSLCQSPSFTLTTNAVPCLANPCPASSFNNQCQPTCPYTGETLLPGQCIGPFTGAAITVNPPSNVQINQPVIIQANINLPGTSDKLAGDSIRFDWGDGTVSTNPSPPGTVASTAGGATTTGGFPAFTAPTSAQHAYTQPGTYTIKVTVTFYDGTSSQVQTTATVTGAPASLPQGLGAPAPAAPTTSVALHSGCNDVTLTFRDGTPVTDVVAAVQGASVTAIYFTPSNAPPLVYFADPNSPSNLASVQHGYQVSICVGGSGTLVQPVS